MSRLLMPAVVILLAISASPARADDAEEKAVQFVEKLGGKVKRDDELPGKPVVGVLLTDTKMTNEDLKELFAFKHLTILYLTNTKVTDGGLKDLVMLKNLTALELSGTNVTDAGVKKLRESLPNCKIKK